MRADSLRAPLPPLRFRPTLKDYVWGGRRLADLLGRKLPEGRIAESWEISDHPHGETPIVGGPHRESTLRDLLTNHGTDLVGQRNAAALDRERFPLLIKLLDANDWLSVQVHPGDAYAKEHEGSYGKTEMWVVLHAEPQAEIILGLERAASPRELAKALEDGSLGDLLHRVPARPGDVFFVPAGTVHAIGPGLLLAEIQQTSDVTYRIFDWNRSDAEGRPRPLHVREALEVIDSSATGCAAAKPLELGAGHELLAECPYFRTERVRLEESSFRGACDGSTFEIWGLVDGVATVNSFDGEIELEAVEWLLLPACLGTFEIRSSQRADLLRISTPPL